MVQAANEAAAPKSAQRFGAELYREQEAEANRGLGRLNRSGDADVPARQQLHERRAKFDDARARQAAKSGRPFSGPACRSSADHDSVAFQ